MRLLGLLAFVFQILIFTHLSYAQSSGYEFYDDFNDRVVDSSKWQWDPNVSTVNVPNTGAHEFNKYLNISLNSSSPYRQSILTSTVVLSGNFDIRTTWFDASIFPLQPVNNVQATRSLFIFGNESSSQLKASIKQGLNTEFPVDQTPDGIYIAFESNNNLQKFPYQKRGPWNKEYLGIQRIGDNISFYRSDVDYYDYSMWDKLGELTSLEDIRFGLFAEILDQDTEYNFLWDDVRLGIAPIPEPATLMMLGSGLIGGAIMRRRKKIKQLG